MKNQENICKPNYIQPMFDDEAPSWMTVEEATDVSHVILEASSSNFQSNTFKARVVIKLEKYNPMWVIVQESHNGAHRIYELDINGRGTGIYMQILSSLGIYNVFYLR